jgi:hypothetical protein
MGVKLQTRWGPRLSIYYVHSRRCQVCLYFPPFVSGASFSGMKSLDPPRKDRRSGPRRAPSYTPEEIDDLRVTRVHFREDYLFCLLSDGNMACVPLTISPRLLAAPRKLRYQWQIEEDGKVIVWHAGNVGFAIERLSLASILTHPEIQITSG